MTFHGIDITGDGPRVLGTTRSGREAALTLRSDGGTARFDVAVSPMPGFENPDDERSAEIELSRVMAEADAISSRLSETLNGELGSLARAELLRRAASVLDRREVETELVEALIELADPSATPTPGA